MGATTTEPPNGTLPWFELLEPFLQALQSQGLLVDIEQRVRLQGLLLRLSAEQRLPDDLDRLRRLITPMLAGSPSEQDLCNVTFQAVFGDQQPAPSPGPIDDGKRKDLGREVDWVNAISLMRGIVAAAISTVIVGLVYIVVAYLSHTQIKEKAAPPPPASVTVAADIGWIKDYPIEELEPPKQSFWNRTWRWYYTEYTPAKWTAVLLPFVLCLGFVAWLYYRMLAYLRREALKQNLRSLSWRMDDIKARFGDRKLISDLQPLRSLARAHVHVLDADSTALASAEAAGQLVPRFTSVAVPTDFVALIDRRSPRDHLAEYSMSVVQTLRDAGLSVEILEFRREPAVARVVRTGEFLRLDAIVQRFADGVILLFAAAEQLADPARRRLVPAAIELRSARAAILVTPESAGAPTPLETQLARHLGLLIVRTTSASVGTLASLLLDVNGRGGPQRKSSASAPAARGSLAAFLAERPGRWMQNAKPNGKDRGRLQALLRQTFSPESLRWLAATTVYPELRWPLTLSLGSSIRDGAGEHQTLDSDVLAISRLPWFRAGWMPEWTRSFLQQSLSAGEKARVRRVILGAIGLSGRSQFRGGLEIRLAKENKSPGDRIKADNILLDYLSPALQSFQQLFAVPDAWARALARRRLWRLAGIIAVAVLVAASASFAALSMLPIDECDLLAASADDDFRIGPGNDSRIFAAFYKDKALAACQSAVARNRASGPWVYGRYLYQLSRIPHDGNVEETKRSATILQYPAAYHGLGYLYYNGEGVPRNLEIAKTYYSDALDLGNTSSLLGLADIARTLGDRQTEYDKLLEYQNKGGTILYHLALFYEEGFPPKIPKPDLNTYIKLLAVGANHGDAVSATELGALYWNGDKEPPDHPYACELYERAIRWRAYAIAASNLAKDYRDGGCGKQDLEKATYWAIFGAKFNNAEALNTLFELISSGRAKFKDGYGPPREFNIATAEFQYGNKLEMIFDERQQVSYLNAAIDWYRKAAASGNQDAKDALKRLKTSE
jgi:TPR repeat protein